MPVMAACLPGDPRDGGSAGSGGARPAGDAVHRSSDPLQAVRTARQRGLETWDTSRVRENPFIVKPWCRHLTLRPLEGGRSPPPA